MGATPIAPLRRRTYLELARDAYIAGRLTIEEFEAQVEELLRNRTADSVKQAPPPPVKLDPTYSYR